MRLLQLRVARVGPFEELTLEFGPQPGPGRSWTVLYGDGGTGKSALLSAILSTRPGRCAALHGVRRRGEESSLAVAHWDISFEQPERGHPAVLATPTAKLGDDDAELLRRKDQAAIDRVAGEGDGYAVVEIPNQRSFSRGAMSISDPTRTLMRYEVRNSLATDPSRSDLTRVTKQSLAYAGIAGALYGDRRGEGDDPRRLDAAMRAAIDAVVGLLGYKYRGIEPYSLEPLFVTPGGSAHLFDSLPTQLKHLVAIAAVSVRTLWSAHRSRDPREIEGLILVDDLELTLGPAAQRGVLSVLRQILPAAQWIVTTSSPEIAAQAEPSELVTLRRSAESDLVELYTDELAITH